MSTEHAVLLVRLGPVVKHPDADTLGITDVDGRPCVVRLAEWAEGDLAIYVPIDSLVPVGDHRFAFLAPKANIFGFAHIQAMRLRGVFSMGLLVKPTKDELAASQLLDDLREHMGIELFDPPDPTDPDAILDPGFLPSFTDIQSARKWGRVLFAPGEEVILAEKIHGETVRAAYRDTRLWVASARNFKRLDDPVPSRSNAWARLARTGAFDRLRDAPGIAFYGEIYGKVSGMKYGATSDVPRWVAFDALDIRSRQWLDYDDFHGLARALALPTVPVVYRGPWSPELVRFAEGATLLGAGAHVREGWVARPVRERYDSRVGRVVLKLHGEDYLTCRRGK